MTRAGQDATVVIVGLGDLGVRVLDAVARLPIGRVVAAGRSADHARGVAGQAALVGALSTGARRVEPLRMDLDDLEATTRSLAALEPAVIVSTASRHTWWRTPPELSAMPYGAWLPMHVPLVRSLMLARAAGAPDARVVCLPYPDAVGPVLAAAGLAPDIGAGNVLEMAAKLAVLAATEARIAPEEVDVRLVAHHAAERYAFSAFTTLGSSQAPTGPPPVRAEVAVGGEQLSAARVRELLTRAYPLMQGRATHGLTAAATAATVAALLGERSIRLHAPAPGGRPGGYPVRVSRSAIELDLPDGLIEDDARAINAVAARWDGIEQITDAGTTVLTAWASHSVRATLGMTLERIALDDHAAVAEELASRSASAAGRAPG